MHVTPFVAQQLRAISAESGSSIGQLVGAVLDYVNEDTATSLIQVYSEVQEKELTKLTNRCGDLTSAITGLSNRRLAKKSLPEERASIITDAADANRQIYALMDELRAWKGKLKLQQG